MTDKRINKTKRNLRKAFWDILEKKRIDKITVKDICEQAEVSRSTFYDHYDSYTTFLNSLSNDVADRVLECLSLYRYDTNTDALVDSLFESMKAEPHLFSLLFTEYFPDARELLLDKLRPIVLKAWTRESNLPQNELEFIHSYFFNSSMWILNEWRSGKIDVSEERIKELYEHLLKYGVYEYLYTK